jgi:hypothetical protein
LARQPFLLKGGIINQVSLSKKFEKYWIEPAKSVFNNIANKNLALYEAKEQL